MLAYTNNAQSTLASAILAGATTVSVAAGDGDLFPAIDAADDDWFPLTLVALDGATYEVLKATARVDDVITVERGQENTPAALDFATGSIVSLRMTSAAFDEFAKSGDETALLTKGLNLAIQTNLDDFPYELSLPGITALEEGLRISFKPALANSRTDATLDLNGLGVKSIRVSYTASNTGLLEIGDFQEHRIIDLHFDVASDRWLADSPVVRYPGPASTISSGLVEQSPFTTDAVFDLNTDPTTFSGAPAFFTRTGISRIIKDFFDAQSSSNFPTMWTNFGSGGLGDKVVTGDETFSAGSYFNYRTFTLNSGAIMRCDFGSVVVIRASEDIVINGDVFFSEANVDAWPVGFVGPRAAPTDVAHTGAVPDYVPSQLFELGGQNTGAALSSGQMYNAVLQGLAMSKFHGGHGRGKLPLGEADSHVKGHGGLILIAPSITINGTAKFHLPTRALNGAGGTETSGVGALAANTSQAAGGMLIAASETLSVQTASRYRVEDPSGAYKTYGEVKVGGTDPALPFAGAAAGMFWQVDLDSNFVGRLI